MVLGDDEVTSKKRGKSQRRARYAVCELNDTVRWMCSWRCVLSRLRDQVKADPEMNSTAGIVVQKLGLNCLVEQDFAGGIV